MILPLRRSRPAIFEPLPRLQLAQARARLDSFQSRLFASNNAIDVVGSNIELLMHPAVFAKTTRTTIDPLSEPGIHRLPALRERELRALALSRLRKLPTRTYPSNVARSRFEIVAALFLSSRRCNSAS